MDNYNNQIYKALDIFLKGFVIFVNENCQKYLGDNWIKLAKDFYFQSKNLELKTKDKKIRWDIYKITNFVLIEQCRNRVFNNTFDTIAYDLIKLINKVRNYVSHQEYDGIKTLNSITLDRAIHFVDAMILISNQIGNKNQSNELSLIKKELIPDDNERLNNFIEIVTLRTEILEEEDSRFPLNYKFEKHMSTKVFGPPGTGKTSKLIDHVKEAISNGVNPRNIGFITFSNEGANVAIDRILKAYPKYWKKDFVNFSTIHALATRIGQFSTGTLFQEEHYKKFDSNIRTYEEWKTKGDPTSRVVRFDHPVLNELTLSNMEIRKLDDHLNDPRYKSYQKNKCLEVLSRYFNQKFIPLSNLPDFFNKYIEDFYDYKNENNLINFDDVVLKVANDEFPKSKLPTFELLIIDEAQDLSKLLWKFVKKIIPLSKDCYIAGDDDQSIMNGIGADPDSFVDFNATNQDIILKDSFRVTKSARNFIDIGVMQLLNTLPKRVKKIWNPSKIDGSVKLFQDDNLSGYGVSSRKAEIDILYLLKIIDKDWKKKKDSLDTIPDWLIMAPTQKSGEEFSNQLKYLNIPHFYRNKPRLDATTEITNINVQTIHKSKGAEAENVAILFLSPQDLRLIVSDVKLAYVALTRSKKNIYPLVTQKGLLPKDRFTTENDMKIFNKIFHNNLLK